MANNWQTNGAKLRMIDESGYPLTGWHRDRIACLNEYSRKRRKARKEAK